MTSVARSAGAGLVALMQGLKFAPESTTVNPIEENRAIELVAPDALAALIDYVVTNKDWPNPSNTLTALIATCGDFHPSDARLAVGFDAGESHDLRKLLVLTVDVDGAVATFQPSPQMEWDHLTAIPVAGTIEWSSDGTYLAACGLTHRADRPFRLYRDGVVLRPLTTMSVTTLQATAAQRSRKLAVSPDRQWIAVVTDAADTVSNDPVGGIWHYDGTNATRVHHPGVGAGQVGIGLDQSGLAALSWLGNGVLVTGRVNSSLVTTWTWDGSALTFAAAHDLPRTGVTVGQLSGSPDGTRLLAAQQSVSGPPKNGGMYLLDHGGGGILSNRRDPTVGGVAYLGLHFGKPEATWRATSSHFVHGSINGSVIVFDREGVATIQFRLDPVLNYLHNYPGWSSQDVIAWGTDHPVYGPIVLASFDGASLTLISQTATLQGPTTLYSGPSGLAWNPSGTRLAARNLTAEAASKSWHASTPTVWEWDGVALRHIPSVDDPPLSSRNLAQEGWSWLDDDTVAVSTGSLVKFGIQRLGTQQTLAWVNRSMPGAGGNHDSGRTEATRGLAWHPSEPLLAIVVHKDGSPSQWRVEVWRITPAAPDAYGPLVAAELVATHGPFPTTGVGTNFYGGVAWSPDGEYIYVASPLLGGELLRWTGETLTLLGNLEAVTEAGGAMRARWSPDGLHLAVTYQTALNMGLRVYRRAGSTLQRLTTTEGAMGLTIAGGLDWVSDSRVMMSFQLGWAVYDVGSEGAVVVETVPANGGRDVVVRRGATTRGTATITASRQRVAR